MRNTEAAFRWIIGILHDHNIPFQIDGGLAARAYGAERELADIDITVPETDIDRLVPMVKEYIVYGPAEYKDDNWNLYLMTLKYENQLIDVSGAYSTNIFNAEAGKWVHSPADLSLYEEKELYGLKVPVIPRHLLIEEKTELERLVDIADLEAIS